MSNIRIITSSVTNPWFNLATEEWLFRHAEPEMNTLFLWRNSETVVVGRYQNPWRECKTDLMEADNVYLARRQSGGGAVFHDLGNTNFTFLSPKADYDQDKNFQIIIDALASLGIDAELSGRNDMTVDGKKVSGSAFKHATDRSFHHGTLLINANMKKLGDYLNPHPLKLKAKGITSVKSRVANLVEFNSELTHETVSQAIIEAFCQTYGQRVKVEALDEETLKVNSYLNEFYEKMSDWNWRFGKTPEFSHQMETRFDWGIVDVNLNVKNAEIKEVIIFSDALDVKLIEAVQKALIGCTYQIGIIYEALDILVNDVPEWTTHIQDLKTWFTTQVK